MTVPSERLRPLKWPAIPQRVRWIAAGTIGTLAILALALGLYWFSHRHDVRPFGVLVPTNSDASWIDLQGSVPHDNCRRRELRAKSREASGSVVVDLTWVQVGPTATVCTLEVRRADWRTVRVELRRPIGDRVVYDGSPGSKNMVPTIGRTDASGERVERVRDALD